VRDFAEAALRRLCGIVAVDRVLGADGVEAPRRPDPRRAASWRGGSCSGVLEVDGCLLAWDDDSSDDSDDDDEDDDCDGDCETDAQSYGQWRRVTGWRRRLLRGRGRRSPACQCRRPNYEHARNTRISVLESRLHAALECHEMSVSCRSLRATAAGGASVLRVSTVTVDNPHSETLHGSQETRTTGHNRHVSCTTIGDCLL